MIKTQVSKILSVQDNIALCCRVVCISIHSGGLYKCAHVQMALA